MSAKGQAKVARIEERRQTKAEVKLHAVMSFLSVSRVVESFGKVELHLIDGRVIYLGTYKNALNFRDAQAAIAAVTHKAINLKKGTKWEHVAQTIFDAVEVQEGFSYTEDDEARGWLEAYCKKRVYRATVDMSNAEELFEALEKQPKGFRTTDGEAFISLEYFMRFVVGEYHTRLTLREAVERLGRLGLKSKQVAARRSDELRRKRLWEVPKSVLDALAEKS
jgi:hypothetical protein